MFNSQPPGAARVPSRIMPPPTIFSLGQTCSHSAGFSHFALWAFLGHWGAGRVVVEAAVWSAVGEVGRGGGERRGGRKRVEVEGRGGGGEEGREGKGRRRSRGKQRGDLRRWEEGGSIQPSAGDMTRRRATLAQFFLLSFTERENGTETSQLRVFSASKAG